MFLSSLLAPSTITPPLRFFQPLATSSRTFSARPSSRHPEPQCRPMKVASSCSADEVRVKLCFLVKVRNAKGRRVAGGRRIGKMVALVTGGANGLGVWAGVPKAVDEEGIVSGGGRAGVLGAKMEALVDLLACILESLVSYIDGDFLNWIFKSPTEEHTETLYGEDYVCKMVTCIA